MGDGGDSTLGAMDEGIVEGESVSEEARERPCDELCSRDLSTKPWLLLSTSREEDSGSGGWPRISADS